MAGLSWGVYVPAIAYGGRELKNPFGSFLCVGVAYFLVAIVVPVLLFMSQNKWPAWNVTGVAFATMAGAAGAIGALGVILARYTGGDPLYIGSLIFGLAPVINALISLVWHPRPGSPWHFALPEVAPGWKLWVGIVMVGVGAALVLYSKEEAEKPQAPAGQPTAQAVAPASARTAE
jgi:hypothetical protein